MAAVACLVSLLCFAFAAAEVSDAAAAGKHSPPPDVASRELTDAGYVIRYNDRLYAYPLRTSPLFLRAPDSAPPESNAIDSDGDDRKRPLFYFTAYESDGPSASRRLPESRPYIEIRKKREVDGEQVPDSSKVGKLRRKRTYCGKCGGGGYGGYYVPVTYAVYPVYPSYYGGGGGKGCHSCGGGGGYGGGGGGSYSYSSSSAQSSAGSFGWGK